ncbi:TIGR02710 family CRISPR-associated CARF protein [Kallotenue papyrolyticum]|uniref:TIGR02710 family CRISPR-associated CARF protein n=1 Tax=Kallotenue papyrolyticum TaxID=1325125 RepID=UPI00049232D2|nr:TIGR02710 family CRISPR-associated CARF protein [Kallotenue papyrolyticum]
MTVIGSSRAFADELAAFRARTRDLGFRGLVLLGSRQSTTAALLIGALQVERVAFLLTDETRQMPDDVAALLGCSPQAWLCPQGNHNTTRAVYQGLRQVLEQWADLDRAAIAVDVTGGLKPMAVGLEKAAHVLGLTTIYVESDYGPLPPDGRPGPLPGTQRLIIPEDPYVVFGDLEAAEAQRLYRKHDYAGAQRIFAALAERVPPPDGRRYALLAQLAAAYAAWDVFDLPAAARDLQAVLHEYAALPAALRATLVEQRAALAKLNQVGERLSKHDTRLAVLQDKQAVLALLGTLHANALRRQEQARYDVAALLRYRCLELIGQQRLAEYGILSERPNFDRFGAGRSALEQRYRQVQKSVGRKQCYPLPERAFGLFVGYMLLKALEDELVHDLSIGMIEARSAARNTSMLTHGFRLIDQVEYESFCEVVEQVLERYLQLVCVSRADWETTFRFVAIDVLTNPEE